jgi:hypothetical protein
MSEHRGCFQAQGRALQKARCWNQDKPLTAADGHRLVDELYALLSVRERKVRERAFEKAHEVIERVAAVDGHYGLTEWNCSHPPGNVERVDVVIWSGLAFTKG